MKNMKNQRGLTLVEILASVAIASLLLTMIFGIIISTKEQQISQTKSNTQLTDISYALKVITKDIRKEGKITQMNENEVDIGTIKFIYKDGVIKRNDDILVENVTNFKFESIYEEVEDEDEDEDEDDIAKEYHIYIENETKHAETIITLRGTKNE